MSFAGRGRTPALGQSPIADRDTGRARTRRLAQDTITTIPGRSMYQQVYDPVADSLGLTSLFAAIPLTLMFVMLGVFKRSPQLSALVSLAATVAVATLVYPMPFSAALNSGLFGVAFAILTIAWILVNAMWIYNMTVETGYFGVLRESFCRISDDLRIQAIIIAFVSAL
jgi:lactate permease